MGVKGGFHRVISVHAMFSFLTKPTRQTSSQNVTIAKLIKRFLGGQQMLQ